jgi:hypothetical protein
VRKRLEAIGRSSSSLVVLLEHVPQTLATWLSGHRSDSPYFPAAEIERALAAASGGRVHARSREP